MFDIVLLINKIQNYKEGNQISPKTKLLSIKTLLYYTFKTLEVGLCDKPVLR